MCHAMAKQHVVIKLRQPLHDERGMPDWLQFIRDKSIIREQVNPDVDRLLVERRLRVWVTREYRRAGLEWSRDEVQEGLDRTYRLIFQQNDAVPSDLVPNLERLPSVDDAWELEIGKSELPPADVAVQSSVVTQKAADLIHLPYAHSITKGSREIKIAVLDTGVNLDHPELKGALVQGADFVDLDGLKTSDFIGDITGSDDIPEDEVGHGTHVSGIIAGRGMEMNEGVAPGCSLMPVRVLATMKSGPRISGAGIIDNISTGLKWMADHDVAVANVSLGIRNAGGGLPHADVIRYALTKNVTIVAASGNDGTSERYYPGALPGVCAVGAVDDAGAVAPFSSYGAPITVVAPGLNIYSSFARNSYAFASGTSQAAPFVCGAVALMKSYALERRQTLTNTDITYVLKHTSDRIDTRMRNERAGYGLLNLTDAFKLLIHLLN